MLNVVGAHVVCKTPRKCCIALLGRPPQGCIPVVLDRVLGPARNFLSNLGPSAARCATCEFMTGTKRAVFSKNHQHIQAIPVSHIFVCNDKQLFLCMCPCVSPDIRAQLVVPPFPTLLANPSGEESCNLAPAAFSEFLHQPGGSNELLHSVEERVAIRQLDNPLLYSTVSYLMSLSSSLFCQFPLILATEYRFLFLPSPSWS